MGRFITQMYTVNIFKHFYPWAEGFHGIVKENDKRMKNGLITCTHRKRDSLSLITIIASREEKFVFSLWPKLVKICKVK